MKWVKRIVIVLIIVADYVSKLSSLSISFRGYRKKPLTWNVLTRNLCEVCLFFADSLLLILGNFLPADVTFLLTKWPIFSFYTLWSEMG